MRVLTGILTILLLLIIVSIGGYFHLKSELVYLKLYTPNVSLASNNKKDIFLEIYDNKKNIIFKKFYQRSKILPPNYDISISSMIIEDALAEGKKFSETYNVSIWKYIVMNQFNVDIYSLKGQVLNLIASDLLKDNNVTGLYGEVLRFHTLDKIKHKYTEDQLTKIYLDNFEYSNNIYGIAAASINYFSKDIENISLLELSYLISMRLINNKNNVQDFHKVLETSAKRSLKKLYDSGKISTDIYEEEISKNITLKIEKYDNLDPAFSKEIIKTLNKDPRFQLGEKNIRAYTSYNQSITKIVESVIRNYFRRNDKKKQTIIVIANKDTGTIEAAVGSRIPKSSRNRAFYVKRQTGSIFKPIVYLTAFANDVAPTDRIVDRPYRFNAGGSIYRPRNYLSVFLGGTLIRNGLTYSLNNATVKLAENTGLEKISKMAKILGADGIVPAYHSIALGALPMSAINIVQIFSTIANLGVKNTPKFLQAVEQEGTYYNLKEKPIRVVDAGSAYQTLYIMQAVSREGTARGARLFPGTASKTGTTNNYLDAWTVGIFGPYVIAVWIGHDDMTSMGSNGSGGRMAAPLLARIQKKLYPRLRRFGLKKPPAIALRRVNRYSGKYDNSKYNTYIEAVKKYSINTTIKRNR